MCKNSKRTSKEFLALPGGDGAKHQRGSLARPLHARIRNTSDPVWARHPLLTSPADIAGEGQRRLLAGLSLSGRGAGLALLILLGAAPAGAVCTQHGTVSSSSTAIVGSNDVAGIEGRHYFMIQNTGTSNPMNVAIGSSNNATSSDLYLGPGASWVMTMQGLKMVPGGDVAAISASGTTYSFCDW
jgi:hypothetical protein